MNEKVDSCQEVGLLLERLGQKDEATTTLP